MRTEGDDGYLGKVTWHSSGEDEGPDVGISLELADGSELWAGEITRRNWENGGDEVAEIGPDTGWWLALYGKDGPTVLGKLAGEQAAHTLMDAITLALQAAKAA